MSVTTAERHLLPALPTSQADPAATHGTTHRTLLQKLSRCASVSVLTTVMSLTMLTVLTAGMGMIAWVANALTVAVVTVPSYMLNKRWTWGHVGPSDFRRQVVPFWGLAFVGLVLSTLAVAATEASGLAAAMPSPFLSTCAVLGAHLSGWAVLWVVQFLILDRVLFAHRS
jgi:putative flippase GtrA